MAKLYRKAFYVNIVDIHSFLGFVSPKSLNGERIQHHINSGAAMALLMSDYQQAKKLTLTGSPSYIIDSGRQAYYGNVGYHVLSANIEHLLVNPVNEEYRY